MNYLGVHVYPALLEESWRDLARERRLEKRVVAPRRRPALPRFALVQRLRGTSPCPSPAEAC
jgi:hypothetical protein